MNTEPPDDLDRLYARLAWENPRPNMTVRVMARVRVAQRIQRISTIASLIALLTLGIFAFALGRGLTFSGALDYLSVLLTNFDVALAATDDFIQALADVMPWAETIAVVLSIVGVWIAAVMLPRLLARRQAGLH